MDTVNLGSVVTVYDYGAKEEVVYKIVSEKEQQGKLLSSKNDSENYVVISINNPVAKALMEKFAGKQVVDAPDGKYEVEILRVDNSQVTVSRNAKAVAELSKINKKVEKERKEEAERREQAKKLEAFYKANPFQGGDCVGK